MDTSALEAAAHRYKRADDALSAARDTLQAEAVAHMRAGVKQAEVARITDWSREYLRRLRDSADKRDAEAEVETLRQQVADLQAAQKQTKSTPAVAVPRQQVTQAVPQTRPQQADPEPGTVELTDAQARRLAQIARKDASSEQRERFRRVKETAESLGRDVDLAIIDAAFAMGLLSDEDVAAAQLHGVDAEPTSAPPAPKES